MKFLKSIILFFVVTIYSNGLLGQSAKETRPKISSASFSSLLNKMIKEKVDLISVDELREKQDEFLILDARERDEYSVSHLEGAIYLGYENVDFSQLDGVDKDTPIVVYCSIGVRSENIGAQLLEQGFTNVQNLYGSIFEWANKGYPIVDNAGYPTKNIHGYSWVWGKWMTNKTYTKQY